MSVRLLADDLTGALDAAVRLVPLAGELPVTWDRGAALDTEGSLALVTNTRDGGADDAVRAVLGLDAFWDASSGTLAFKKIDSLWRGNTLPELAALIESGAFVTVIVATAFPEQNRVTRDGLQFWRRPGERDWMLAAQDLRAGLVARDIAVNVAPVGALPQPGFSGVWMFDAETTADLDAVVACGRHATGPVLWCGAAGLAGALAPQPPHAATTQITMPATIIVGSDHGVSRSQVEAVRAADVATVIAFGADETQWDGAVAAARDATRSVVLWFSPATQLVPDQAETVMSAFFERLAAGFRPRGALVVSGGETLFRLCRAAQASRVIALCEISPGIAQARIAGGGWDGLSLISKSGAFGASDFLATMLRKGSL